MSEPRDDCLGGQGSCFPLWVEHVFLCPCPVHAPLRLAGLLWIHMPTPRRGSAHRWSGGRGGTLAGPRGSSKNRCLYLQEIFVFPHSSGKFHRGEHKLWFIFVFVNPNLVPYSFRISIYGGTSVHELDPFHDSGHKLSWTRTESNSMIRFGVDLRENLIRFSSSSVCDPNRGKNCESRYHCASVHTPLPPH